LPNVRLREPGTRAPATFGFATRDPDTQRKMRVVGKAIMALSLVIGVGAGTVPVDYDKPRGGPVCVAAAVGDTIKFEWVRAVCAVQGCAGAANGREGEKEVKRMGDRLGRNELTKSSDGWYCNQRARASFTICMSFPIGRATRSASLAQPRRWLMPRLIPASL
jgi:hypothetical protein